jgi:hypothetical protein
MDKESSGKLIKIGKGLIDIQRDRNRDKQELLVADMYRIKLSPPQLS